MKVIWEDKAVESLGDIYDFLFELASESVAEKTTSIISESVLNLEIMPFMGTEVRGNRLRRVLCITKVKYLVPYEVDESTDTVRILDIISQKMSRNIK